MISPNIPGKHTKHPSEIKVIMVRKANLLYWEKLIPQINPFLGFLVFSGGIKWEHWPEMG